MLCKHQEVSRWRTTANDPISLAEEEATGVRQETNSTENWWQVMAFVVLIVQTQEDVYQIQRASRDTAELVCRASARGEGGLQKG